MKKNDLSKIILSIGLIVVLIVVGNAQSKSASIIERNVRAEMNFLAGDAMQGRGSGTIFERIAAEYIASHFMQFGIEPAGEKDAQNNPTFIQTVSVPGRESLQNLQIGGDLGKSIIFGKNLAAYSISSREISGELQKIRFGDKVNKGAIVLLSLNANDKFEDFMPKMVQLFRDGATAVFLTETNQTKEDWAELSERKLMLSSRGRNLFVLTAEAAKVLSDVTDGTKIEIKSTFAEGAKTYTWNAVGKITGKDSKLSAEVILISSHLDHLGVRQNAPTSDKIFNGADDDASGTVAVMELARVLSGGKKPKRTIYFVCFGSEEAGGYGSRHFVDNLPFAKEKLVANLQFEMIGRPDPKVKSEELWLTGYDRSNLGKELAKQGAKLVADPHPEQNFFQRSDNYTLARQGIVAHTVSSFGLHKDYHQATDEISTIDFVHLTKSINLMVKPIKWLANSNFKPTWYEGKNPKQ